MFVARGFDDGYFLRFETIEQLYENMCKYNQDVSPSLDKLCELLETDFCAVVKIFNEDYLVFEPAE